MAKFNCSSSAFVRSGSVDMSIRTSIIALSLLSMSAVGCSEDPVIGSWKSSKQNLAFASDGTLRSLEAAAKAQAVSTECEDAGYSDTVEQCAEGDWTPNGEGYEFETSNLVVLDGGSRVNCSCSHQQFYAVLADANLVVYDKKGGLTLDTLRR
jgi:hypothetical protein